jgi:hypothetical protein
MYVYLFASLLLPNIDLDYDNNSSSPEEVSRLLRRELLERFRHELFATKQEPDPGLLRVVRECEQLLTDSGCFTASSGSEDFNTSVRALGDNHNNKIRHGSSQARHANGVIVHGAPVMTKKEIECYDDCFEDDSGVSIASFSIVRRRYSSPEFSSFDNEPSGPPSWDIPGPINARISEDSHVPSPRVKTKPTVESEEPPILTEVVPKAPEMRLPAYLDLRPKAVWLSSWVRDVPTTGQMLPASPTEAVESGSDEEMDWWSEGSSPGMHVTAMEQAATLAKTAAVKLLESFSVWKEHGNFRSKPNWKEAQKSKASAPGISNPFDPSCANSTQSDPGFKVPSRKRPSDDEDDGRPSQRRKTAPLGEQSRGKLLACPFAKNNPMMHSKCYKYMILEISRLKYAMLPCICHPL